MEQSLKIPVTDSQVEVVSAVVVYPENATAMILLAHGAGAGYKHVFMEELAQALANEGIATLRFNFPYMEAGKKFPRSPKSAIQACQDVLIYAQEHYPKTPIFLAGKSYGGRMASHLVAEQNIAIKGLIFYGFPLHAPGKPGKERAKHLTSVGVPMLFLQGINDKLADLTLLNEVIKPLKQVNLITFEHADHSFKRPKKISKESLVPTLAYETKKWIEAHN